jgi:hypothetical protein
VRVERLAPLSRRLCSETKSACEGLYPTSARNTVGADERAANAALIARAPELLAEVERLRQETADLRELIADERLRHAQERSNLAEQKLAERRMRYEVEEEDKRAIAAVERQRDELADALLALYTFPRVRERLAPKGSLGSIADQVEAALESTGRLPRG